MICRRAAAPVAGDAGTAQFFGAFLGILDQVRLGDQRTRRAHHVAHAGGDRRIAVGNGGEAAENAEHRDLAGARVLRHPLLEVVGVEVDQLLLEGDAGVAEEEPGTQRPAGVVLVADEQLHGVVPLAVGNARGITWAPAPLR